MSLGFDEFLGAKQIHRDMIILRQNLYAESKHGVFQYYLDHENELDDVEKRKFEALKKKYNPKNKKK